MPAERGLDAHDHFGRRRSVGNDSETDDDLWNPKRQGERGGTTDQPFRTEIQENATTDQRQVVRHGRRSLQRNASARCASLCAQPEGAELVQEGVEIRVSSAWGHSHAPAECVTVSSRPSVSAGGRSMS